MTEAADIYDEIFGSLEWPMVIVTVRADDDGERAGCLVGFHTQCSIEPRRHLVMISVENHTWRVIRRASAVAVHVLDRDHTDLAHAFGEHTGDDPDTDKWEGVSTGPEPGPPILDGAAAWFAGPIVGRFEMGDHLGLLVEPERAERRRELADADQFGFQQAKGLRPGHPA